MRSKTHKIENQNRTTIKGIDEIDFRGLLGVRARVSSLRNACRQLSTQSSRRLAVTRSGDQRLDAAQQIT